MNNTTRHAKKNYKKVGKGGEGRNVKECLTLGEKKKRKEWESGSHQMKRYFVSCCLVLTYFLRIGQAPQHK